MQKTHFGTLVIALPLFLAGCPKDTAPAAPDAAEAPAAASSDASTPGTDAGAKLGAADAGAGYTRADRAAFLKPLDAGRKKSRAKDYAGALADFDRALAVAPNEPRVLAEVGWAALNANELPRADAANRRALALTKEPVLRAQILYNSGRVAEAKKDTDAARKSYAESLSLRDNAEVKKRLASVGGAPENGLPCAAGAPSAEQLCTCMLKPNVTPFMMEGERPVCAVDPVSLTLPTPRVAVMRYGAETIGERVYMLAAREGGSLRPLADLGHDYEPGAFGVHNEATVKGGELKIIGPRTVLVVKSEQHNNDTNMAGLELCTDYEDLETVCTIPNDKKPMRCVTVPVSITAGCGAGVSVDEADLDADTKEALANLKGGWHKSDVKLTWSVSDDGKLVVQKSSGDAALVPAGIVGPHPLF